MKTDSIKSNRAPLREKSRTTQITYEASANTWTNEPIRAAFGAGPAHYCSADGPWDLRRMAETFADQIVRTIYSLREDAEKGPDHWCSLCLRLDERLFVRVDDDAIRVYAEDPQTARNTIERLGRTFRKIPEPKPPTFQIVKQSSGSIDTEAVRIEETARLDSRLLGLHYGEDFPAWHEDFVEMLTERKRGLSIFDGPPGTGKTSYLRQLMIQLKDTHRFYFISSANLRLLRDAEFVDFWAGERRLHEECAMVVILEDSETALMPRGFDNRQEVSLLLSITDGILGEFLKLQVICTINCEVEQLDSALLRPGRLLAHRHFGRLSRERAEKLAHELGTTLPLSRDYSLAEVFSGQLEQRTPKAPIGFGHRGN